MFEGSRRRIEPQPLESPQQEIDFLEIPLVLEAVMEKAEKENKALTCGISMTSNRRINRITLGNQ